MTVAVLFRSLRARNPAVRQRACSALGDMGHRPAAQSLALVLGHPIGDPSPQVRAAAAKALGQIGDPDVVSALVLALRDPSSSVCAESATALGRLGDRKALFPLIAALGDPDFGVRVAAARALGKLRDPLATIPLIAVLGDDRFFPGARTNDRVLPNFLGKMDEMLCTAVADALREIGDPRAVQPLLRLLEPVVSPPSVRRRAIEALAKLRANDALEVLLYAFQEDPDPAVRLWAAFGLAEIATPPACDALATAVEQGDRDTRCAAAYALGKSKDPRALELLVRALEDPVWQVRAGAALGLGKLGDGRAVKALLPRVQDTERDVRGLAYWALRELGVPSEFVLESAVRSADEGPLPHAIQVTAEELPEILVDLMFPGSH